MISLPARCRSGRIATPASPISPCRTLRRRRPNLSAPSGNSASGERSSTARPTGIILETPASPYHAAAIDGVQIDTVSLDVPDTGGRPLVIEGTGGLMVPLSRSTLYIDIFARWQLPIVLCARTELGTINHSLLSIEALRNRTIEILGIAFIGERNSESESAICEIGRVRWLGRLPRLSPLTANSLRAAFSTSFRRDDFNL
ncbi:dethiobiotin synthase [Ancylobacter dichloromethanicus]|nr:dethiobiotin synthase [Ancylobacter dichloromethanicus]